jgi:RHS repeat-associated protein
VVDTVAGSTRIRNLHADHLNTPRLATDEQGKIIWRNSPLTEPFGNSSPEEDPDGDGIPFTLNLRFPGQYFDRESNLHYNYFRDYDPLTGRYIQADPIGLAGGSMSLYTYANNAPTMYTELLHFLRDWLVNHILVEDRRYEAHFHNEKRSKSILGRFFARLR